MHSGRRRPTVRERRALVRAALAEDRIRTQAQLVGHLRTRGHAVTQASVSRDLRELGARKIGGRYRIAPDRQTRLTGLAAMIESFTPAGPWLVVVRTAPGGAQRAAHAIDVGEWPELAGSVAGDDTIFLACHDREGQAEVLVRLRLAVGERGSPGPRREDRRRSEPAALRATHPPRRAGGRLGPVGKPLPGEPGRSRVAAYPKGRAVAVRFRGVGGITPCHADPRPALRGCLVGAGGS